MTDFDQASAADRAGVQVQQLIVMPHLRAARLASRCSFDFLMRLQTSEHKKGLGAL